MIPDWADVLILDAVARTWPGHVRAVRAAYDAQTDSFRVDVLMKPDPHQQVRITITTQALGGG